MIAAASLCSDFSPSPSPPMIFERPLTPFMPYCPGWLLSVRGRDATDCGLPLRPVHPPCTRFATVCNPALPPSAPMLHPRIMGWAAHFKHGK